MNRLISSQQASKNTIDREIIEIEYRLYLPLSNEWIMETNSIYPEVWLKTESKDDAFWTGCFDIIVNLGKRLANEKHLEFGKTIKPHCTITYQESWLVE